MAKADTNKDPDATLSKILGQSNTSSLASGSVEDPNDAETTSMETCLVSVLHSIIVERYEGDKCGDVFHGEGVAYFQGGRVYKGCFSRGFMEGRGEYVWSDGVTYQGEFKSNVPMGRGSYTWLDGSTYEGEIRGGLRHGVGTYKCAKTSTVYRGQWCQGKRRGKGTMYYNQEATSWYEGEWMDNRREGWGVRRYASGNVYEGHWNNNVRHGEGTMKWVRLDQQYSGQWVNGVQDGKGTHTWFRKRMPCSQYPCMNEYTGEFFQGMRHGTGTFLYASGAVYCGGWSRDRKHGWGRYTSENGRVFEGEFVKDCMVEFPAFTPGMSAPSTPVPDDGDSPKKLTQSSGHSSPLGSDMTLNIQTLLNRIPEASRHQELRQVEFAVLRHIGTLRDIYSFYSGLGNERTPDKTFPLSHLQFSRLLKDCKIHQLGITLAQIERLINEDTCSPFTTILPRECVSYIIIVAYHVCHRDIESSNNLLASCFSKLMRQNIVPNAKNVKGLLYLHPVHSVVACNYTNRCWDIYQALRKANSAHAHQTLTVRQFVWMLKDLCLYDNDLTVFKVLEIVSVENPAIGTHCNLQAEMTFLEFFEALLGCAEAKGRRNQTAEERPPDVDHNEDMVAPSHQTSQLSTNEKTEERQHPIPFKEADEDTGDQGWIQKTQMFFSQIFFPVYEHSMRVKEMVKDERLKKIEKTRSSFVVEEETRQGQQSEIKQKDENI